MKLRVNGRVCEVEGDPSVGSVLRELRVGRRSVAVVVNGRVIPRARRRAAKLRPGDTVDVVTLAGGG